MATDDTMTSQRLMAELHNATVASNEAYTKIIQQVLDDIVLRASEADRKALFEEEERNKLNNEHIERIMQLQVAHEMDERLNSDRFNAAKAALAKLQKENIEMSNRLTERMAEVESKRVALDAKSVALDAKSAALKAELKAMEKRDWTQQSRVVLDVGGHKFTTWIRTLRSNPGCMLGAMFSGRFSVNEEADGSVFIDRDGSNFGYVLGYLRDGVVALDPAQDDIQLLHQLKREFGYYAIDLSESQDAAFAYAGHDIIVHNSKTGTWVDVTPMPSSRTHSSVCGQHGSLYVFGGQDAAYKYMRTVLAYTPSTKQWATVSTMPAALVYHSTCAMGDNDIYCMGGITSDAHATDTCWKYNPAAPRGQQQWTRLASMPEPRYSFGVGVIGKYIYVVGGLNNQAMMKPSLYRYDTQTDNWSTMKPMPAPVEYQHSTVALGGMLYTVGGIGSSDVYRYNHESGKWNTTKRMINTNQVCGLFLHDGRLHASGNTIKTRREVQTYDPVADSWSLSPVSPPGFIPYGGSFGMTKVEHNAIDCMIANATNAKMTREAQETKHTIARLNTIDLTID